MYISQLYQYPVKSLKGREMSSMEIDDFGPKWDRRWMLVDEKGRFVTQRQCPKMGQVGVTVLLDKVVFDFQQETQSLSLDQAQGSTTQKLVNVWDDAVLGNPVEHEVNQWLSDKLQRHVQLIFMPQATLRQVDTEFAQQGDRVSFADGFPFLILSEASIEFMSEKVGFELSPLRFRPNILVSGCEAFAEDAWKRIAIGDIEFEIVKPCSRCVIPTLDLATSEKQPEVMKALLAHRKQGKHVMMGQNAIHRQLGDITVGQEVKVLA
ncbi:MAG: MOSC domain-containing protein [Gammaproteobacteria bacterium]|nr:MOSC domain-containing protein [Gammaproteobacteria bacterium]